VSEDDNRGQKRKWRTLEKLAAVVQEGRDWTRRERQRDVDGGRRVVVTREENREERGLAGGAHFVAWAGVAGSGPSIMGIGPVPSSQKALKNWRG